VLRYRTPVVMLPCYGVRVCHPCPLARWLGDHERGGSNTQAGGGQSPRASVAPRPTINRTFGRVAHSDESHARRSTARPDDQPHRPAINRVPRRQPHPPRRARGHPANDYTRDTPCARVTCEKSSQERKVVEGPDPPDSAPDDRVARDGTEDSTVTRVRAVVTHDPQVTRGHHDGPEVTRHGSCR
jgi:hypothetical protein